MQKYHGELQFDLITVQHTVYTLDFIFLYFRMGWKELLDHPFWTQVLKEEAYGEEEEKINEGHEEEKNSCDGVDPAESRYVDILFHFFFLQRPQHFTDVLVQLFYCIKLCFVVMKTLMEKVLKKFFFKKLKMIQCISTACQQPAGLP